MAGIAHLPNEHQLLAPVTDFCVCCEVSTYLLAGSFVLRPLVLQASKTVATSK
jgi:hypothetical protein